MKSRCQSGLVVSKPAPRAPRGGCTPMPVPLVRLTGQQSRMMLLPSSLALIRFTLSLSRSRTHSSKAKHCHHHGRAPPTALAAHTA